VEEVLGMTVKLNQRGYDHASEVIKAGKVVLDERGAWSEHQPSTRQQNRYIEEYGLDGYGRWFLGIDDSEGEDTKGRYKFPYGDFEKVHRCGVLTAESRAGQYKHFDIERAAAHLHGMLDALMGRPESARSGR
jgi:hypothetical protein